MPSATSAGRTRDALSPATREARVKRAQRSGAKRGSRTVRRGSASPSARAGNGVANSLESLLARANRIGAYEQPDGDGAGAREILRVERSDGGTLVLDCLAGTFTDARLLAQLSADEPVENAWVLARIYLGDENRGRCRRLSAEELLSGDLAGPSAEREVALLLPSSLLDSRGRCYVISKLATSTEHFALRWVRSADAEAQAVLETVTLRDVVAAMEDYEPARSMTLRALARHAEQTRVSTRQLSEESDRLTRSPIVLNRALRERVQRALTDGTTMSEIAKRCGRFKRDRRGKLSGETSWLARRIGAMPEGGESEPTVWIHSNSLALIARQGLGVNPNEVEL